MGGVTLPVSTILPAPAKWYPVSFPKRIRQCYFKTLRYIKTPMS